MVNKCDSAGKLALVLSILFFGPIIFLIFDCNVNIVLPQQLIEQIRDVIANGKQEKRNARHQNDHQLLRENKIEVRFGQMDLCLSTEI